MSRKQFLIASVVLYIVACNLPALEFQRNEAATDIWYGGQVAGIGWIGMFVGQFAWFANPLWLAAGILLMARRPRWSIVCTCLALLISLDTWSLYGQELPGDEGGVSKLTLRRIREGTYVWLASFLALLFGALWQWLQPQTVPTTASTSPDHSAAAPEAKP